MVAPIAVPILERSRPSLRSAILRPTAAPATPANTAPPIHIAAPTAASATLHTKGPRFEFTVLPPISADPRPACRVSPQAL